MWRSALSLVAASAPSSVTSPTRRPSEATTGRWRIARAHTRDRAVEELVVADRRDRARHDALDRPVGAALEGDAAGDIALGQDAAGSLACIYDNDRGTVGTAEQSDRVRDGRADGKRRDGPDIRTGTAAEQRCRRPFRHVLARRLAALARHRPLLDARIDRAAGPAPSLSPRLGGMAMRGTP